MADDDADVLLLDVVVVFVAADARQYASSVESGIHSMALSQIAIALAVSKVAHMYHASGWRESVQTI